MSTATHTDSEPRDSLAWPADVAFALMVALLGAMAARLVAVELATSLIFSIHVAVSLYDGRFDRLRTTAWIMVFGSWAVLGLAMAGPSLSVLSWLSPLCSSLIMVGAAVDMAALYGSRVRRSRAAQVVAVIAVAIVVLIAADDLRRVFSAIETNQVSKLDAAAPLLGEDAFQPLQALQRSLGAPLLTTNLLLALVGLWPWRRVWRFHARPSRDTFTALWLGALACWIDLGLNGAAPQAATVLSKVPALYELAFLALAPFALGRLQRAHAAPVSGEA